MKAILFSLAFFSAHAFAGPPIKVMPVMNVKVQPCVQWSTTGQCSLVGTEYEAAGRVQVNQVVDLLLERIVKLEKEVEKLQAAQK